MMKCKMCGKDFEKLRFYFGHGLCDGCVDGVKEYIQITVGIAELERKKRNKMKVRAKGERKAYYDGYKMCGDCLEQYLTDEGKQVLKALLEAVKTSIEIDDIWENGKESEHNDEGR